MNEKYKIHFSYIIGILISIIIALITVEWGGIEKLVNYISFALTLTSLSLAVLAIVYSIYSESNISERVMELKESSQKISDTASEIESMTGNLRGQIHSITDNITSVSDKLDKTKNIVENISKSDLNAPNKGEAKYDKKEMTAEQIISYSSIKGRHAMYVSYLSYRYEVHFDPYDIIENIDWMDMYFYGWIMAMDAFNIINASYSEKSSTKIVWFKDDIINELKDYTQSQKKMGTDIGRDFKEIESYFKNIQQKKNTKRRVK